MTEARDAVLARVRKALGRTAEEEARARLRVEAWAASPDRRRLPARGQLGDEARVTLFIERARAVQTEIERVEGPAPVPDAVSRYLRRHNLPHKLIMAPDPALDEIDWRTRPLLRIRRGAAEDKDAVGLTLATAGIAETGTLLLTSSPDRPTLLAYLPETSIVLLASDRIVGSYEQALDLYREESDSLPRSVNFVTGPSRTGDIGQKLELGAHGPKRLLVVVVDPEPSRSDGEEPAAAQRQQ